MQTVRDLIQIPHWLWKLRALTGDTLRRDIREWLSPPDPSVNYNLTSEARHEGTGLWFIQCSAFQSWKASGSLLWVYGKRMLSRLFSPILIDFPFQSRLRQERSHVRHPMRLDFAE
jgi:hypothetical protein